ncbi:hypothetical protein Btru_053422 [Bulinus truncatus]|nr:hypothetical protein Btru_053422 [Bulinus truncatus]
MCLVVSLSALVLFLPVAGAVGPGAKIRLTRKGLDYASSVVHDIFATRLQNFKLSDTTLRNGKDSVTLTNIKKISVNPPNVRMTLSPEVNGATISLTNFGIDLSSNVLVNVIILWKMRTYEGSVGLKAQDVSLTVQVRFGSDLSGRPTVKLENCQANVDILDVNFIGVSSFFLNTVISLTKDLLKNYLNEQICQFIQRELHEAAQNEMSGMRDSALIDFHISVKNCENSVITNTKMFRLRYNIFSTVSVTFNIDDKFVMDYSLDRSPVVTQDYIEILNKGIVYWKDDMKPLSGPTLPFPEILDVNSMLHVWLTENMANSFAEAAHRHNYISFNLTKEELSPEIQPMLRTTCPPITCIGAAIPEIGKAVANSMVEMRIKSSAAPQLAITSSSVTVRLYGVVDMVAVTSYGTFMDIMKLNVTLSVVGNAFLRDQKLMARITEHDTTVTLLDSRIGNVNMANIQHYLGNLVRLAIIGRLNAFGNEGIELPMVNDFTFDQSKIQLFNGFLVISTNLLWAGL